jgi:hypothetical protein
MVDSFAFPTKEAEVTVANTTLTAPADVDDTVVWSLTRDKKGQVIWENIFDQIYRCDSP